MDTPPLLLALVLLLRLLRLSPPPCHAAALVLPLRKHLLSQPSPALPQHARSSLAAATMPADVADLNTEGLGRYTVPLALGTPPQTQYAALDTGSGVIHVPCADAAAASLSAARQLPLFDPSASSTASGPAACNAAACQALCGPQFPSTGCPDTSSYEYTVESCSATSCACSGRYACEYAITYADGSGSKGAVYADAATFNGDPSTTATLAFGCATSFPPPPSVYTDKSPYFVGLNWQPGSLLSQLQAAGVIDDTFGICLGDGASDLQAVPPSLPDYGFNAPTAHGLLVLGSATLVAPLPQTLSTSLIDTAAYNADADAVSATGPLFPGLWLSMTAATLGPGGPSLMPAGGAGTATGGGYPMLLDSGTSLAAFPDAMALTLLAALDPALRAAQGVVTAGYDPTYSGGIAVAFSSPQTPAQLDDVPSLPTLELTLGPPGASATLPLSPSRYLFPNSTRWPDAVWVFPLIPLSLTRSLGGQAGILGNSILRNLWVQATRSSLAVTIGVLDVGASCDSLAFDNGTTSSVNATYGAPPSGSSTSSSGSSGSSSSSSSSSNGAGVGSSSGTGSSNGGSSDTWWIVVAACGGLALLLGVAVALFRFRQGKVERSPNPQAVPLASWTRG